METVYTKKQSSKALVSFAPHSLGKLIEWKQQSLFNWSILQKI
jgi:hypothetical protein